MILAAGRGERLRPLTDTIPKALVDVGGKSLLERHLENVRAAGIDNVVINLGWHGEQIVQRVGSGERFGLNVVFSQEGDNILETGGGIHRALPMLGDAPFIVVNADVFTDMPLPRQLASDMLGHLVLVPTPDHKAQGDFDLVDGKIAVGDAPAYTFSGIALYRPELFAGCEPGRFPLAPLLREAADRGVLSGELFDGGWEDVGTPERLERVRAQLLTR
ncbi:MAG: nucleotidyltransferase family protein [Woeseiaceae bacterium]|nr:nucleotidyltransferase family protein [Woeseiaceae bacterium]